MFWFGAQVLSQTPATLPHHSLDTVEQLPPERLPPPRAIKGVGNLHVPITGSPEAQRWFDQGINLYHDFWDYEAARAFEQSIRVDPKCAMCYWGLYKAESFYHSNSPAYAAPALAKAVSLQEGVTDRERLYIRATSADFPQAVELWRNLTRQYPDDLHAQVLLALTLQDGVDEHGEPRRGQKEALEILEHVMAADPENSAAHHYYVHALEASAHPDRALHSEGAALGAAGEWSAARQAYTKALIERPRSGFSLYGLALCSERLGDSVKAADEYATFLAAWKEADKTLPEVAHARAYLEAHRKATTSAVRR